MRKKILIFAAAAAALTGGARAQESARPRDDASFVSQKVPFTLRVEETAPVTIEMRNSGTTSWDSSIHLRATQRNWRIVAAHAAETGTVEPGATKTFSFSVVAPDVPGAYPFQFQVVRKNRSFGEPSPPLLIRVEAPVTGNDAKFVSQDIPPRMAERVLYPVSVTMQNTGKTRWTAAAGYALDFEPNFKLDRPVRIALGPSDSIAPGGRKTFSFMLEGPKDWAKLHWRMIQEGTGRFGGVTPEVVIHNPRFYGNLDLADCRTIAGWAEDAGDLKQHLRVAILADGTQFAFVTADRFRADLAAARVGKGDHSFEIATPAFLFDGKPHSIGAFVTSSGGHELSQSPRSITCVAPEQTSR